MRWNLAVLGGMLAVCSGAGCQLVIGIGDWVEASGGTGGGTAGGGAGGTGGVTTGGTGGTGGASCTPGEKVACYTGPAGTEGVGTCKGGMATCNDQGTGYGGCEGQVVPGPEVPDAIGDEACDGYAPGEPVWWRTFGDDKDQWPDAIASDGQGNVFVCGTFGGTLEFDDNDPLTSQGAHNIFLVKLDRDGKALWSKRFGDATEQVGCKIAVDQEDNVLVAGGWYGSIFFGGSLLTPNPGPGVFAAKFDPSGNHVWSKVYEAAFDVVVSAVTADQGGDLILAGASFGSVSPFSGSAKTGYDLFLARLSGTDGAPLWGRVFPDGGAAGDGDDFIDDVAVAPTGHIIAAGRYTGTVVLGPGVNLDQMNDAPFFWADFDALGNAVWANPAADEVSVSFIGVERAPDGALLGYFTQGLDFGFGVRNLDSTAQGTSYLWGFDPGSPSAIVFSRGADGSVGLAVAEQTAADLGGGLLGPGAAGGGQSNVLVTRRDSSGKHVWSRTFGGPELSGTDLQVRPAVVSTADGSVVVAMSFAGKANVGGAVLTSVGQAGLGDLAVVRIAP